MATCPKCGRTLSDNVYMSLSKANVQGRTTQVTCACGHTITYSQRNGISRAEQKRREEEATQQSWQREADLRKNTRTPRICALISTALILFYATCVGISAGRLDGVLPGIGQGMVTLVWMGAWITIGFALARSTATPPPTVRAQYTLKGIIRHDPRIAPMLRGIGYIVLFVAGFISLQRAIAIIHFMRLVGG